MKESSFLFRGIRTIFQKKKTRVLALSVLFLIVVIFMGLIFHSGEKKKKDPILKIIPDNVDLQIRNFHYTEVGDANWKWEINADTAKYVKKENLAYFDNVKMRIIRADGKMITMTGKSGCFHTDSKNAKISGDVLLVTDTNDRMVTDHLNYSNVDRTVFTDEPVEFKNSQLTIKGKGMTFLIKEEKIKLHERISAIYTRQ
jgi:LPS export ABC transporter protein LptC